MANQNESLNVNAKTVDEAIEQGLNQLGLTRDQVDIEVISEGKRSLFGLKSEEAVVRLRPKAQDTEAEGDSGLTDSDISQEATEEISAPAGAEMPAAEDDTSNEMVELGTEHLSELLKLMGIEADVTHRTASDLVEAGEEPPVVLDVTGRDLGILIGRRNETLQALQFMVRLMVSKQMGSWQPVVVDVESYRARRRQSLRQMAQRMAERAVANDERVVLEAMPAYERRLVHLALRDHPDVYTKSVGRDNNRKVTIIPK